MLRGSWASPGTEMDAGLGTRQARSEPQTLQTPYEAVFHVL